MPFQPRRLLRNLHGFVFAARKGTGSKILHGTMWMYIQQVLLQAGNFIRTVILARLLDPKDFGLFGIAVAVSRILEVLSATGLKQALVQFGKPDRVHMNTVWTVTVLRGLILFLLLMLTAPWIATFYDAPSATGIIQAVSVCFIFQGFQNVGLINLQRNLKFPLLARMNIVVNLIQILISIGVAFWLRNAWALVFGLLAQKAATLVLSYRIEPYRPRPCLNREKLKQLYQFGFWIFAASIANFVTQQGDKMIMAKLLSVEMLGYYSMAFGLSRLPGVMVGVVSRVLFAAFCKYKDDPVLMRKHFLQTVRVIPALTFPLCLFLAMEAEDIIGIIMGERWLPAAPVLSILSVSMLIRTIGSSSGAALNAVGRPSWTFRIMSLRMAVILGCIYPFTITLGLGMPGTAAAMLASSILSLPVIILGIRKSIHVTLMDWIQSLVCPVGCMGLMAAAIGLTGHLVPGPGSLLLALKFMIGFIVYIGALYSLAKTFRLALYHDMVTIIEKVRP